MPVCANSGVYVPRDTHGCDAAVLVRHHLAGFLERVEEGSHAPLPDFVQGALHGFSVCGDFSQGFVRTACCRCGDERRVPFPCKGRGFCPSCMGRRMAEGAALLVDQVLPPVGYRQWVLSFSGPLAVRLGYDRELLAAVPERLARALVTDGAFEERACELPFLAAPPPTPERMTAILARVHDAIIAQDPLTSAMVGGCSWLRPQPSADGESSERS